MHRIFRQKLTACGVYVLFCSQKDLDLFLEHTRAKFVGFHVKNDTRSLAGLPQPIHEGVKVLNQVGNKNYHLPLLLLAYNI